MTILIFSEPIWQLWVASHVQDYSKDQQKLDSLISLWNLKDSIPKGAADQKIKHRLFSFDPNKTSSSDLQILGFSKDVASRMVRYREKGGVFRMKSDVLKMYGVDSAHYLQLHVFIDLPEKRESKPVFVSNPQIIAKKSVETFDLNVADTSQLKKIYGIGEKLSLRIIKYRDALGGFVRQDQMKEVYGLDSTVVNRLMKQSFIDNAFTPTKININAISEKELAIHPYISNKEARAIVAYRFQHGEFKALTDIRNILGVDAETIRKIAPYLKFND